MADIALNFLFAFLGIIAHRVFTQPASPAPFSVPGVPAIGPGGSGSPGPFAGVGHNQLLALLAQLLSGVAQQLQPTTPATAPAAGVVHVPIQLHVSGQSPSNSTGSV